MIDQTIKAITLHQPWATLVASRQKVFETRSWPTKHRGPLVIHAAKTRAHLDLCRHDPFYSCLLEGRVYGPHLPLGLVIAVCNLMNVTKCTPVNTAGLSSTELALGDFSPGRYAWHLTNVEQLLFPEPVRGYQRLWTWDFSKTSDVNRGHILKVRHLWKLMEERTHQ